MSKRSQIKRITRECLVLRHMRRCRHISMRAAGAMIGVCGSTISHCEQGRMNFPPGRIPDLIRGYGFTQSDFDEFVMGRPLPVLDIRDECVQMIARLEATKLKPLHAVLLSFLNQ